MKKLIKIKNHYYLCSDEEINIGDWVVEWQHKDYPERHFLNSEYVIAKDIQKKIIASTEQLGELYLLDEKQIKRLFSEKHLKISREILSADKRFSEKDLDNIMFGYEVGIQKNSNKKFTLDELEMSFKEGFNLCLSNFYHLLKGKIHPDIEPFETPAMDLDDYIQSITKEQTEWEVEAEVTGEFVNILSINEIQ